VSPKKTLTRFDRQLTFFLVGRKTSTILFEIISNPSDVSKPVVNVPFSLTLWGVTFTSSDLNTTVNILGKKAGDIRPAFQKNRQIMTLNEDNEDMYDGNTAEVKRLLGFEIAFMSPRVKETVSEKEKHAKL